MKVSVNVFFLELVPLRGEKIFKPRLHNRLLVPVTVLFSKFLTSIPVLFLWESPEESNWRST